MVKGQTVRARDDVAHSSVENVMVLVAPVGHMEAAEMTGGTVSVKVAAGQDPVPVMFDGPPSQRLDS